MYTGKTKPKQNKKLKSIDLLDYFNGIKVNAFIYWCPLFYEGINEGFQTSTGTTLPNTTDGRKVLRILYNKAGYIRSKNALEESFFIELKPKWFDKVYFSDGNQYEVIRLNINQSINLDNKEVIKEYIFSMI